MRLYSRNTGSIDRVIPTTPSPTHQATRYEFRAAYHARMSNPRPRHRSQFDEDLDEWSKDWQALKDGWREMAQNDQQGTRTSDPWLDDLNRTEVFFWNYERRIEERRRQDELDALATEYFTEPDSAQHALDRL